MTCGFVSRQFPAEVSFDEAKTYAVLTGCGLEVGSYVGLRGVGGGTWPRCLSSRWRTYTPWRRRRC
ncbi:MAG: hypothetical protein ABWU84_12720 [Pyrobaculum sp.]|uniref:hypothetical protein n=1 Tax=Pyrobaculum sp. TaxID=2004705 RepID=UPI003EEF28E4